MTSSYFRQLAREKRENAILLRRIALATDDVVKKTHLEAKVDVEETTAKEYENFADKLEQDEKGY